MYEHTVLWLKLFAFRNTELHVTCNRDEYVNLFLHSVEVFPERGYPQNTDGNRFFQYLYD